MTTTSSKANPVLIAFSVSAAVDGLVLFDGFADLFPGKLGLWIVAVNLMLKLGLGFYVRGVVVPVANVAARVTDAGRVIPGDGFALVPSPIGQVTEVREDATGIQLTGVMRPHDQVTLVREGGTEQRFR